eukprot:gene57597-biopygen39914
MTFAGVKFALPSQLAFCGDHARGFLPPLLSIPGLRCLRGSHAQAPLFVALRRHRVSFSVPNTQGKDWHQNRSGNEQKMRQELHVALGGTGSLMLGQPVFYDYPTPNPRGAAGSIITAKALQSKGNRGLGRRGGGGQNGPVRDLKEFKRMPRPKRKPSPSAAQVQAFPKRSQAQSDQAQAQVKRKRKSSASASASQAQPKRRSPKHSRNTPTMSGSPNAARPSRRRAGAVVGADDHRDAVLSRSCMSPKDDDHIEAQGAEPGAGR